MKTTGNNGCLERSMANEDDKTPSPLK